MLTAVTALTATLLTGLGTAGTAQAAAVDTNASYVLVNRGSGKALDVAGAAAPPPAACTHDPGCAFGLGRAASPPRQPMDGLRSSSSGVAQARPRSALHPVIRHVPAGEPWNRSGPTLEAAVGNQP
ncbi:hypothetical protein QFZ22_001462 [Streptomyces canus]|uniref:Uncharacterized protein n=1 Tax=Streptomyces canus TaxID=58343 RepID=A0AAW8F5R6_9ACTN|nr:hypothetical protein [Streptomyces canus]MDQ0905477.1 hypothetical protein [Streptomyces canus]